MPILTLRLCFYVWYPDGVDQFYQGRDICKEAASEHNSNCIAGSEHSRKGILVEKMQELNAKTQATSSLQADFWSQSFIDAIAETDYYRSILACKTGAGDDISCAQTADCDYGCKCSANKCTQDTISIPTNDLGNKLGIVFRLIALYERRNVNRDFFSVELGGFDTHFEMVAGLNSKFNVINPAIHAFRQELKNAVLDDGTTLWDKVVLVMTSEFGRTVSPNSSSGTDHGWGGNAYMMGGKVAGGRTLGLHPSTYSPDDDHNTG